MGRAHLIQSKTGRPTKRTPEVERTIRAALGKGLSYQTAAELAGILPDTLRRWRRDDTDFSADCKRAKAEGKANIVGKLIENANSGNVTAQIFWLKTRTEEFREHRPDDTEDVQRRQVEFVRRGAGASN